MRKRSIIVRAKRSCATACIRSEQGVCAAEDLRGAMKSIERREGACRLVRGRKY